MMWRMIDLHRFTRTVGGEIVAATRVRGACSYKRHRQQHEQHPGDFRADGLLEETPMPMVGL